MLNRILDYIPLSNLRKKHVPDSSLEQSTSIPTQQIPNVTRFLVDAIADPKLSIKDAVIDALSFLSGKELKTIYTELETLRTPGISAEEYSPGVLLHGENAYEAFSILTGCEHKVSNLAKCIYQFTNAVQYVLFLNKELFSKEIDIDSPKCSMVHFQSALSSCIESFSESPEIGIVNLQKIISVNNAKKILYELEMLFSTDIIEEMQIRRWHVSKEALQVVIRRSGITIPIDPIEVFNRIYDELSQLVSGKAPEKTILANSSDTIRRHQIATEAYEIFFEGRSLLKLVAVAQRVTIHTGVRHGK